MNESDSKKTHMIRSTPELAKQVEAFKQLVRENSLGDAVRKQGKDPDSYAFLWEPKTHNYLRYAIALAAACIKAPILQREGGWVERAGVDPSTLQVQAVLTCQVYAGGGPKQRKRLPAGSRKRAGSRKGDQ